MNKRMKAGALLVAGVFVLTGCAGGSEGSEGAAPTESATPEPVPAVGAEQYTAEELEAALEAVNAELGLDASIDNDSSLRPQLEGASLADIQTTPEQCHTLISSALDEGIGDGIIATMLMENLGLITLVSYEDTSAPERIASTNEQMLTDCAEFELATQGVTVAASVEEIDAATQAPVTQGFKTTVTREGGSGEAVQISAISGTTQISMTMFDLPDMEASVAETEEIIDAILAELEK